MQLSKPLSFMAAAIAVAAAAPLDLATDGTNTGPGNGIAKSVYLNCLGTEVWQCTCLQSSLLKGRCWVFYEYRY